jgi:glycosyltransferase involved in cell wall biosynthesis
MPRGPRVLQIVHGAAWGGAERHVRDLSLGLAARGFAPLVVLTARRPRDGPFRLAGLELVCIPRGRGFLGALRSLARRTGAVLAHLHSGSYPALALRTLRGIRLVETRHGLGRPEAQRLAPSARDALRGMASGWLVAATVATCRADAETWRRLGEASGRVVHVPNGVDLPDWVPLPRSKVLRIGFVGRLSPEKGLRELLEALRRVRRAVELEVVGEGPLAGPLVRQGTVPGLAGRVRWHGFRDDPLRYLQGWHLLVVPSHREGCPYAVLEALGSGRPVLGTRVGGLVDLIQEGRWGWLVEPGDPEALARAIERIPGDPRVLEAMGRAGRRFVARHYPLERMVDGILALYRSLGVAPGRP